MAQPSDAEGAPDLIGAARDEFDRTGVERSEADVGEGAGDRIERYTLVEELGEGGMGTVWRAEQTEPVQRQVALKIIKLGMDTREVVVRFEAERQALALMDHPHIAKVHDGGATREGRPYFVMELVEGAPITTYCEEAGLGLRARLELFTRVCEAIQHAHQKGVIHRDIKPSNVLVATVDGAPVPKVIDFGIAKATSAELTQKTLFTQYAQVIGTPEYMAPEQAEMSGHDIDTRADVYSLGVLLYELLTGTKPFDLRDVLALGYQELLRTIREDEPPRPSTRVSTFSESPSRVMARQVGVPALSKRLRGDLDWIVMKALEKDRARRYETADGFRSDVERYLRDLPVLAAPPGTAYRLAKFVRRRRKTVAFVGVIALLLVAGSVGTGVGWVRARAAERDASLRAAELEEVAAFQAAQLSGLDPQRMGVRLREDLIGAAQSEQRASLTRAVEGLNFTNLALETLRTNLFERTLQAIDEHFAAQPLVQAELLATTGQTLVHLGLSEQGGAPLERALATLRRERGDTHGDTLAAALALADQRYGLDRFDEAEALYRQVIAGRRALLGDEDPATLTARSELAAMMLHQNRLDEAAPVIEELLELRRRMFGEDDARTRVALSQVAALRKAQGEFAQAEELQRDVLERCRRAEGDRDTTTLVALKGLGEILWLQKEFEEAESYFQEAYEGSRMVRGDDHPDTLAALNDLANLYGDQGRSAEAERLLREVLERKRRVLGPSHTSTMISMNNLSLVLQDQGRLDEALDLAHETLEICEEAYGGEHPRTLIAMSNLARVYEALGDVEQSVALMRETVELSAELYGEERVEAGLPLFNLAATLRAHGEFEEAAEYFERCAATQRSVADSQPDILAMSVAGMGMCHFALGRYDEAEAPLREGVALLAGSRVPEMQVQLLRSFLGATLSELGHYAEAEPYLVEAAEWMDTSAEMLQPVLNQRDRIAETMEFVVALYSAWHAAEPQGGHDVTAASWRRRLEQRGE